MKRSFWILPLVLGVSLGSIYFLPKAGAVAESAVNMTLPETSGPWFLRPQPPSEEEIKILAKDTQFSKAICYSARPGEFTPEGKPVANRIDLSIVLSGHDLNNSIHRPERCMPAQGHHITSSQDVVLQMPDGREFPAKRLRSIQKLPINEERTEYRQFDCITYYFFVGHDQVTANHLGRTFIDMKDRLAYGLDQRWAYASASMWFGDVPWIAQPVSEQEADETLRQFLTDLAETQIHWDQIKP